MPTDCASQCHISMDLAHLHLHGQLCHCIATLLEKNCFLISNLNLPWHNLRPLPLILSLLPGSRAQPLLPSPQPPFRMLQTAINFPLSLLFSRLSHPSSLSHSHKIPWCSRPFTAPLSFYGHASQPQCLLCSEGQPQHLPIPLPLPRAHQCSTHPASITGNFSSSVL